MNELSASVRSKTAETSQFPDVTMTIESILAEGNEVAVRLTARGTNRGAIGGVIPPTGREFVAVQSHWFRVEDRKLAEHWAVRDDLSTMVQLGVIQPPGPPDGGPRGER